MNENKRGLSTRKQTFSSWPHANIVAIVSIEWIFVLRSSRYDGHWRGDSENILVYWWKVLV